MKKYKAVETNPPVKNLPRVNRNTVNRLLESDENENPREAALFMSLGHDDVVARLASSMTPEGHPSFPYHLEVVARLAASLVKESNFIQAAKDAVALLDACKAELSEIIVKETWRVHDEMMRSVGIPSDMSFAAAARFVTDSNLDGVAQPRFRRFVRFLIQTNQIHVASEQSMPPAVKNNRRSKADPVRETVDDKLSQWIELHSGSISGKTLRRWKDEYPEWHSYERREIRSKNGKLGGRGNKKPKLK